MDSLRNPIGPFVSLSPFTSDDRNRLIEQIPHLSDDLRALIAGLSSERLRTPYRPGGWSIRQIVHHMADNDMNAYMRFKRALTEEEPTASSYREDLWGELSDYQEVPVDNSVQLLRLLHNRFVALLRRLQPEQFARTLRTEALGRVTLDVALQRFVWHNRHHLAQIRSTVAANGWQA